MHAKSEDLRRSVNEINHLLEALRASSVADEEALVEIETLERTRRSLVNLLESRRKQNKLPIVSLQAWRDGNLTAPSFNAQRLAAMATANRPALGAPRPYRVS